MDVKLELGAQTEVVNVTGETEIVQTETGAREGLLRAEQIENLSIIGRSSMELLRIMPGVVPLDQDQLQTVGFGQGGNNTTGYTVNGVRGTNNVVTLDGSMLMDIGSNNGVIINPNPDMVESVKMLTSNYAAEYGTAGVQVSAISKGGSNEFHGSAYVYSRHHELAANDRSNSIAGNEKPPSAVPVPGSEPERSPHQGQAVLLRRLRVPAAAGGHGHALRGGADHGPAQRRLLRVRERYGRQPAPAPAGADPRRLPGSGHARPPTTTSRPTSTPWARPSSTSTRGPITWTRATGTTTRVTSCGPWTAGRACCGSTTTSARAPRRTCAWPTPRRPTTSPAGCGGTPVRTRCRRPCAATTTGCPAPSAW